MKRILPMYETQHWNGPPAPRPDLYPQVAGDGLMCSRAIASRDVVAIVVAQGARPALLSFAAGHRCAQPAPACCADMSMGRAAVRLTALAACGVTILNIQRLSA